MSFLRKIWFLSSMLEILQCDELRNIYLNMYIFKFTYIPITTVLLVGKLSFHVPVTKK